MTRNSILFILFILSNFFRQSYALSLLHNHIPQFGFTAHSLRSLAVAPNVASKRTVVKNPLYSNNRSIGLPWHNAIGRPTGVMISRA